MAFVRPTLAELASRIQEDLRSRLSLASPLLRRSMVHVLSRGIAGAVHMLHGHLEYLARQVFPDRSEKEFLVRQAGLFGIARRPAEYASGPASVSGTNGSIIPAGSVLLRADGAAYEVDAEVTIAGGVAAPNVTAVVAGADGNADQGVPLAFESPIAGVNAAATVGAGGIVNGSDEESDDALRARLLARLREPPHGGAAADYIAWALEVPGVTRAWVFPLEGGAGTVTVRFVRDDDATLIPDAAEVAAVQAHIDEARPVTATVTVAAPVAVALNLTVAITPDTSVTRAAVEAELRDMLRRVAKPGGTIPLSKIKGAVDGAEGVTDWTVTAPAADVTHASGQLAVLGTVTWS